MASLQSVANGVKQCAWSWLCWVAVLLDQYFWTFLHWTVTSIEDSLWRGVQCILYAPLTLLGSGSLYVGLLSTFESLRTASPIWWFIFLELAIAALTMLALLVLRMAQMTALIGWLLLAQVLIGSVSWGWLLVLQSAGGVVLLMCVLLLRVTGAMVSFGRVLLLRIFGTTNP